MRMRAVAIAVVALCALAGPGSAKAPHVITVAGPGIDGEVDLRPLIGEGLELILLPLGRALTGRIDPPVTPLPPGYTFAWYSVSGDPPVPGVDRLVYHPAAIGDSLVEVVATSPLFVPESAVGWYRVDATTARGLDRAVARAQDDMRGATAYVFEPTDGSDYSHWWVPVGVEGAEPAAAPTSDPERPRSDRTPGLGVLAVFGLAAAGALVIRARRVRRTAASAVSGATTV